MTTAIRQPVPTSLSPRLIDRLAALRVPAVLLDVAAARTALRPLTPLNWLQRELASAPPFLLAAAKAWEGAADAADAPLLAWPGVWLAPLTAPPRRRQGPRVAAPMAMLITPLFLESDQFQLLCQHARLDVRAALARIDVAALVTDGEVERLASTLRWMHEDCVDRVRRDGEVHGLSSELSEAYEELSLMYKLASSLTVDQSPRKTLTDACRELQLVSGVRWLALHLTEEDVRMGDMAGEVFRAGQGRGDKDAMRDAARHLTGMNLAAGKVLIIDDCRASNVPGLADLSDNLIAVPVGEHGRFGVLMGGEKPDGAEITSVDGKLFCGLANSLSIYVENFLLYEDMQAMFYGTLHALTAAIDAKDRYTHGHSERVALMSRDLARAAGLSEHEIERVYIAGLMHDVGKIGVPEAVLTKPGRLSSEEFDLVKMHPAIGARILQDIRQMADLIPGVLYHHERWDGRGYPHGRAGNDIPLLGRLICLADSFDAMSSSRTYRASMPHEQVLNEIRRCAGTQFDPRLASLFVQLDFTPYVQMIQRHQAALPVRQSA